MRSTAFHSHSSLPMRVRSLSTRVRVRLLPRTFDIHGSNVWWVWSGFTNTVLNRPRTLAQHTTCAWLAMARKIEKVKEDILKTLDESVQGLRHELSARIESALASPTTPQIHNSGLPGQEQHRLEPGTCIACTNHTLADLLLVELCIHRLQ